jgi:tryptophanyl-tRNA synthetase
MADPISSKKGRIVSGMRPTGKLHLGNYVGALRNWVNLQDAYDCFFFIADWHALTTDYANTSDVKQNSLEVMIDYLAAGLTLNAALSSFNRMCHSTLSCTCYSA